MQNVKWLNYQYQLLRYEHDALSGEFANLGMVYFDAESSTVIWRFEENKYGRLTHFFGDKVQGNYLLSVLKNLSKAFRNIHEESLSRFSTIESLTASVLAPDNNGLSFSAAWKGRHFDHQQNFDELYERIIGRYHKVDSPLQDTSIYHSNK